MVADDVDFIETATAQHYHETVAMRKQKADALTMPVKVEKQPRFAEAQSERQNRLLVVLSIFIAFRRYA